MADPFLDVDGFAAEYQGALTEGETATAERLLQVVSDGIRALKSDVDATAAAMVVFEVVRDAMMYGHLGLLASFQNTTSRRSESGVFATGRSHLVDDFLSDRQRRLLGISPSSVKPRSSFTKCDY